MKSASKDAVGLETLERKRMYGMIMLFVDKYDEPYTGWVKSEINGTLSTLGYLKKGQKQGVWMAWHPNSKKKSEIEWKKEFYENGSLEAQAENKIGTLVNIEVFLINGGKCEDSKVVDGSGTFIDYDINGSALRSRTFENGVEIDSLWFNQQKP